MFPKNSNFSKTVNASISNSHSSLESKENISNIKFLINKFSL